MREPASALEKARAAGAEGAWSVAYALIPQLDPGSLPGNDLELLADAAWWTVHLDESLELRQQAYRAFVAEGAAARAAHAGWFLHFDYLWFKGNEALASGWLGRAARQLANAPPCVEHGYLAFARANGAREHGQLDEADRCAHEALAVAEAHGDGDLVALVLQELGQIHIGRGEVAEGVALMDEAMCAAVNGELSPVYTGWIFCSVLLACFALADLRRATEWTEAAITWCDAQQAATPYHGLCRVHQVEMTTLRGAWGDAATAALRAIEELSALDPAVTGDAYYVSGELHRRRGDLSAAEDAFTRARELGRDPQPGMALVRLAQGRLDDAAAGLRPSLQHTLGPPLTRARLLDAHVQISLARGDVDAAGTASVELDALSAGSEGSVLGATARLARASVHLDEGAPDLAAGEARQADELFRDLRMPFEATRGRVVLGRACRDLGDEAGGVAELKSARHAFESLGAAGELRRVNELLGPATDAPAKLTPREVQVLRLVASGQTNPEIADELALSRHTVGRHVQNIFTKLGVSSRAAAAAFAAHHELT